LIIAGNLAKGGAEKQIYLLAESLVKNGNSVCVVCLTRGEYYQRKIESAGIPVQWAGKSTSILARCLRIFRIAREFHPDAIYSGHFYCNLYAAITGKLIAGLSIGSLRNDGIHEVQRNGKWGTALLRAADAVFANSQQACWNAIDLGRKPEALFYFPNAIDISGMAEIDAPANLPDNHRISFLFLGRLIPQKRADLFVDALAELVGSGMDCTGIITGDGEERSKLQQQAQARGLGEANITFMGAVEESTDLLLRADALVLCSDFEGFPNVILEAMAAGVPVIATRVGAVGELIRDGWNGILIHPGSINELKQAMIKMAASQSLRQSMGMNGRRIVISEFNAQAQSAKFLKLVGMAARQTNRRTLFRLLE
jgi:glycosyltransferase involved in cell wall biosynthesis